MREQIYGVSELARYLELELRIYLPQCPSESVMLYLAGNRTNISIGQPLGIDVRGLRSVTGHGECRAQLPMVAFACLSLQNGRFAMINWIVDGCSSRAAEQDGGE